MTSNVEPSGIVQTHQVIAYFQNKTQKRAASQIRLTWPKSASLSLLIFVQSLARLHFVKIGRSCVAQRLKISMKSGWMQIS